MAGRVEVIRRRRLKQQWYARFVAKNGKVLGHTEGYKNQGDVMEMLARYFPGWDVKVKD